MFVSVVVPVYNAGHSIRPCLLALLHQSVDRSLYEIIVVDDGSSDNTAEVIKTFPEIKLISQENRGPAAARNHGARAARGKLLLFTDADCVPFHNWISEMIKPFQGNSEIVGVKGIYKSHQSSMTARFVQLEYEDKYDRMRKFKYIDFIDTYSAAFKKDIFLKAGGYDESFPVPCAEDVELSFRLANLGLKMVLNDKAIVYHRHPLKFIDYIKKKFKFAYWRVLAVKKNKSQMIKDSHTPQSMKVQLLLAPCIVGLLLMAVFSSQFYFYFKVSFGGYFLLTVPFIVKAFKKDVRVAFLTPLYLFSRSLSQFCGLILGAMSVFCHHELVGRGDLITKGDAAPEI